MLNFGTDSIPTLYYFGIAFYFDLSLDNKFADLCTDDN